MNTFTYEAPADEAAALKAVARPSSAFIAGGTTLVDLWKMGALQPDHVVDINALPYRGVTATPEKLQLGALERMAVAADHPDLVRFYPLVAKSLLLAASAQLRNMASLGGNLLQRPRSDTYRHPELRKLPLYPTRNDAIFATGGRVAFPHPSDLAVALTALDASVRLRSPRGERTIELSRFYLAPNDTPERLTTLASDEMIISIEAPGLPYGRRSTYVKIRDRSSYQFALVSVAAALDIEGGKIRDVRLAAGGVGAKPWRLPQVEAALREKPNTVASYEAAAKLAGEGAETHAQNVYKVRLLERTIVRALSEIGGLS